MKPRKKEKSAAPVSRRPAGVEARRDLRSDLIALGLLAALTLLMFADVLFVTDSLVLSSGNTDIFLEYSHWRAFGFSELRHGNLALWDPYLFCGAPFFGGAQAALLYPPNALFLFLPLGAAINWSIALHIFLAGAFTYAWVAHRGLRAPSCFLAAVIYMFGGANFLHIYSGYLSFLCGFVWAPLLFLAIDGLFEKPTVGWSLLGMLAVAMQVLAGNPQSTFYTAVAAGFYCAFGLVKVEFRLKFVLGLAGIVLGGAALSAVQLFAGFDEWREMLRSSGVPFSFAAMFSFPPENFLTLLTPHLFGDVKTVPYWGRCYLWEMSLFMGVSGFVLAVLGAAWGSGRTRRFSVAMIILLLLLALGAHTPLFHVLYLHVPGFDKFRGNSKFIFLASLFLALLAGIGFDELLRGRRLRNSIVVSIFFFGLLLIGAGVLTYPIAPASTMWKSIMVAIGKGGESYVRPEAYEHLPFLFDAGRMASASLAVGGATLAVICLMLWLTGRWRFAPHGLLGLAVVELFAFARLSLDHFPLEQAVNPAITAFLGEHPGDYRIANLDNPNTALSMRAQDVWGYEPGVVLRYAQIIAAIRGLPPEQAVLLTTLDDAFRPDNPLVRLLRCRFLFAGNRERMEISENKNYLPHVLLVPRCRILDDRTQIFSRLVDPAFDPSREVILETPPEPAPAESNNPGSARLMEFATDYLTIEADLTSPAILLIPDVYAKGWRALALPGSSQERYQIQPADWCLRAIPLAAGRHKIRVEYAPLGFRIGKWISLASVPSFFLLGFFALRRFVHSESWRGAAALSHPDPAADGPASNLWQVGEEGWYRMTIASAVVSGALMILWPEIGRRILEYGLSPAPLVGLALVVIWSALKLARRWRKNAGRKSALILLVIVLFAIVAYQQISIAKNEVDPGKAIAAGTRSAQSLNDTIGETLLKEGKWDAAINHYQGLLMTNPTVAVAHQNLAIALLRQRKPDEAFLHLEQAVRLDPKLPEAQANLANLFLQKGLMEQAVVHYEAVLALQPGNLYCLNNLAWILATSPQPRARDASRAVQLAEEAARLSGNTNPSILETLAAAYGEAGRFSNAVATASRGLELARARTNAAQLRSLEAELRLYQAGMPFRDSYSTNADSGTRP